MPTLQINSGRRSWAEVPVSKSDNGHLKHIRSFRRLEPQDQKSDTSFSQFREMPLPKRVQLSHVGIHVLPWISIQASSRKR